MTNPSEAYNVTLLLVRGLLNPSDVTGTPLCEHLPHLEASLYGKQALILAAAAEPQASARSIAGQLVTSLRTLKATSGSSSMNASSNTSSLHVSTISDGIEAALMGAPYQRFKAAIMACNIATAEGRREAFEAATAGDCVLPIRLIMAGEVTLARRDAALGILLSLRPFLPEWFTHAAVIDATGAIHPALTKWSITGADNQLTGFMDSFLKAEYVMDWYGSHKQPGLYHFLSAKQNGPLAALNEEDRYCIPSALRDLAKFGQSQFSALGYPSIPTAQPGGGPIGYSFATWFEYLAEVVEMATTLPSPVAKLDWIDDVHEQALASLSLMSKLVRAEIFATERLAERSLNALLPHDCAPATYLRTKVLEFVEDQAREARMRPFTARADASSSNLRADAYTIPLRSSRKKRKPELQLGKAGKAGARAETEGQTRLVKVPVWLSRNKLLLVSGVVWDVPALAAALNVSVDSKCWAVILSRQADAKRQALCPKHGAGSVHASITSAAHQLPDFDREKHKDYSRPPTPSERKRYDEACAKASRAAQARSPAKPASKGKPNFRRPAKA